MPLNPNPQAFPSDEQRRVIERVRGAHLVLAPAGSGKTQVMTARLQKAIESGIAPERTLCVTFTNRAAEEMRARIATDLEGIARKIEVRTFHGLCAAFLREVASRIGIPRDFAIYDEQDAIEILSVVLARSQTRLAGAKPRDVFFTLAERKSGALPPELSLDRVPPLFQGVGEEAEKLVAERYHRVLADRGALDFADLVYRIRALLEFDPEERSKFENRYDWIQIDEVQDTHFSEYDVIRRLAGRTRNLTLFGDIDQTIYEWRGSDPDSILGRFRREFQPVIEHQLTLNFRATKSLIAYADRFAATFSRRRTRLSADDSLPEGEPPRVAFFKTSEAEAKSIAKEVGTLRAKDASLRIGILGRTHARLVEISAALAASNVPHVTVEEFEFFRRQEIKDAIARLRLIQSPDDSGALRRSLLRPASRVGKATLDKLSQLGPASGLRLTDLARVRTLAQGEPFGRLLHAFERGSIVIVDVETTGLSTAVDEVIEIAAIRVENGAIRDQFHRWIRPTRPVGESEGIHGYSDAHLKQHGIASEVALREFLAYAKDAHLVGHNVRFDIAMLRAATERARLTWPAFDYDDTLDLARRFIPSPRLDLGSLAEQLALAHRPTHRAEDDTLATLDLLKILVEKAGETAAARAALVSELGKPFLPLAEQIDRWREMARSVRPPILLERILDESGLLTHYAPARERATNLRELCTIFARLDGKILPPPIALAEIVQYAALARNVDQLGEDDDRVPVVTVHQAKGLEFDVVFVAGLSDGEFPSFFAVREQRLDEERRLFYVAITRARRRLFLSGHERNARGYVVGRSPFLLK